MGPAAIIACTVLAWAVWERRWTLRPSNDEVRIMERSVTIGLIDMAIGMFLCTPLAGATVGRALHAISGQWNLSAFIGNCCLASCIGPIGLSLFSRTKMSTDKLRAGFRQHVERPMTAAFPIALFFFCNSPNAKIYRPRFLDCPTDWWLDAYWSVMCALTIWLLGRITWVLIGLRRDPANRPVACLYCLGSILGIILCGFRVYTTYADIPCRVPTWWSYAAIATIFAVSARQSWRRQVDRFTKEPTRS